MTVTWSLASSQLFLSAFLFKVTVSISRSLLSALDLIISTTSSRDSVSAFFSSTAMIWLRSSPSTFLSNISSRSSISAFLARNALTSSAETLVLRASLKVSTSTLRSTLSLSEDISCCVALVPCSALYSDCTWSTRSWSRDSSDLKLSSSMCLSSSFCTSDLLGFCSTS